MQIDQIWIFRLDIDKKLERSGSSGSLMSQTDIQLLLGGTTHSSSAALSDAILPEAAWVDKKFKIILTMRAA